MSTNIRTLVTFLGKAQTGNYRKANYRFADGQVKTTPFFWFGPA